MTYRWPNGAKLALSLVVNVEEGAEQNVDDGDKGPEPVDELQAVPGRKPIRAHAAASSYQYGIKEGAARIRRVLDEAGASATWTAAAVALERAPELAAAIVARGDEIACHGLRWIPQFEMDEAQERAFIRGGTDLIARVAGVRPRGWLSRYLFTDNTRRLLLEEGYDYHMDDFSADAPFWDIVPLADSTSKPLAILPYAVDTNDMKFWLTPAFSPGDWLSYVKDTLDCLLEEGENQLRMMSVGVHLRIIGRPGRIGVYRDFVAYARSQPGVWIATRAEILNAFVGLAPPVHG